MRRQSREERKALRKLKRKEPALSKYNAYGFKDPTPYNAIRDMRGEDIVY